MDLHDVYDSENLFARILDGREPFFRIFENNAALAFLDIYPQRPGHTIVIPKRKGVTNLLDFPSPEVGPFMRSVQLVAQQIVRCLSPDGLGLYQFNGAAAGQTIYHLHVHLIPHQEGQLVFAHGKAPRSDDTFLEELASRLRACAANGIG